MSEETKNRLRSAGDNGNHAPSERGERNHTMSKQKPHWKEITVAGLPAERAARLKAAQSFMNVSGVEDWKWSGGMFKEPATIIYLGKLDFSKAPEGVTITANEPEAEQSASEIAPSPATTSSEAPAAKPHKERKSRARKSRGLKKVKK
jgi:hypothetical protein